MKKIFLLIVIVFLSILFFSNSELRTIFVFNDREYQDNYDSDYFYISSNKIKINTNNLEKYFNYDEMKIIGIYPNIDKIYNQTLKKNLSYYSFNPLKNLKININSFTNNFVSELKNNNYIDMGNMVYFDGINIDSVLVYSPYHYIYLHNQQYNLFNYQIKEF